MRTWIHVLWFTIHVYGQKVFEKIMYPDFDYFDIFVGVPIQRLNAIYSIELSNTIFYDDTCDTQSNCARHCSDETFARMYCEPACQSKYQIIFTSCNTVKSSFQKDRYSYALIDSTTFKFLNENTWNSSVWFTNPLSGKLFTDKLVFVPTIFDWSGNLEIQNAVMVVGTLLYEDLFGRQNNTIVGLGPGENNMVAQLYAQNLIPHPIVHFTINSTYRTLLKIGNYGDDEHCVNWTEHANKHENRWVLEVDSLELNGVRYERKLKALITNHDSFISVPLDFMNTVVEAGIVKKLNETETVIEDVDYYIDCNQSLELQMTVDGRLLAIPTTLLKQRQSKSENCFPWIRKMDSLRYNNHVELIIGLPFLNRFCVSFDYNEQIIRLAEQF
ncbi:hypothetical protein M3Y95_01034000 [Aphelenchoides besseyi]|nr:hypothetical protein M3Y95_01034000 [Aphelenchoides besseyi]